MKDERKLNKKCFFILLVAQIALLKCTIIVIYGVIIVIYRQYHMFCPLYGIILRTLMKHLYTFAMSINNKG